MATTHELELAGNALMANLSLEDLVRHRIQVQKDQREEIPIHINNPAVNMKVAKTEWLIALDFMIKMKKEY